jgi:hypothetical protein
MPKIFACIFFFTCIIIVSCLPGKKFSHWKEKEVKAVYSGGHHGYVALTLYADSTFKYVSGSDVMGLKSVRTGVYFKEDSSIILYRWKKKYFSRQSIADTLRLKGDYVYMYSATKDKTADSAFYSDYYRLSLEK